MKKKLTKKEETVPPKKSRRRGQRNISEVPHSTFNFNLLQLTNHNNYNNNFKISFLSFFVAMGALMGIVIFYNCNEWRQEEVEEDEN